MALCFDMEIISFSAVFHSDWNVNVFLLQTCPYWFYTVFIESETGGRADFLTWVVSAIASSDRG
jgi:hypothetical protein